MSWWIQQCLTSRAAEHTPARNRREILFVANRVIHSFRTLFYATISRRTVPQQREDVVSIVCDVRTRTTLQASSCNYYMHTSLCEILLLRLTSAGTYSYYSTSSLFFYPADGAQPLAAVKGYVGNHNSRYAVCSAVVWPRSSGEKYLCRKESNPDRPEHSLVSYIVWFTS